MMKKLILYTWLLLLASCGQKSGHSVSDNLENQNVIYGQDSRLDIPTAKLSTPARATGLLFNRRLLQALSNQTWAYKKMSLRQAYPLCESENFRDQVVLGSCSSVLIGPKTVLTAGHCIRSQAQCADALFIFGHTYEESLLGYLVSSQIFSCQKLLKFEQKIGDKGADYSIIEMDREVIGIEPVKIADSQNEKAGDIVANYSYPLGLPLKLDVGKILRNSSQSNFIEVAVDTFGGSSGSGLFNSKNELIGILSRGSDDFLEEDIYRVQTFGGCISVNRCSNGSTCLGERFYKASLIKEVLDGLQK